MAGRTIIDKGIIVTVNDENQIHFGGHVVLEGDRITAVGVDSFSGEIGLNDRVIDATDCIVMPGLVDLH